MGFSGLGFQGWLKWPYYAFGNYFGEEGHGFWVCFVGLHRLAFFWLCVFGPWFLLWCAEQDWSHVLIERELI